MTTLTFRSVKLIHPVERFPTAMVYQNNILSMMNFSALNTINIILKHIRWSRFPAVKMLPPCVKTTSLIVKSAWRS